MPLKGNWIFQMQFQVLALMMTLIMILETVRNLGELLHFREIQYLLGLALPRQALHKGRAVNIFKKNGKTWRYEGKVVSPSPQTGDNFGRALAIQDNLLVVTARKNTDERGAAYVFEKKGQGYAYKASLKAGDSADGDYFGQSVALQGNFIVIGARNTAGPDGATAGGFYLFRRKVVSGSRLQR